MKKSEVYEAIICALCDALNCIGTGFGCALGFAMAMWFLSWNEKNKKVKEVRKKWSQITK